MRTTLFVVLSAVVILAPATLAQDAQPLEQTIYLHETLHIVPERINAAEGDQISARVLNAGSTPHDILFCGDGPNEQSTCRDRWSFVRLEPGQEANITVPVKKAGTFEYFCSIPGHKQGGMRGELMVQGVATDEKGIPLGASLALLALVASASLALRRRG